MRRVKLIVALVGLFTLATAGCNDTPKPTDKNKSNTTGKSGDAAKPADGSGSK